MAPSSNIVVTTKEGDVQINAGAVAMIFEDGHDVAILNLSDSKNGDVKLTGIKNGAVLPGQQLVLTRNSSANFAEINPASAIATRKMAKARLTSDITAFISEFSILSALHNGGLHRQLSQTSDGRAALDKILRSAACLQLVTASHGPYTVPKTREQ
jgi:hypothetical protein